MAFSLSHGPAASTTYARVTGLAPVILLLLGGDVGLVDVVGQPKRQVRFARGTRVVECVDVDAIEAVGLAFGHRGPDRLGDRRRGLLTGQPVLVVDRVELRR